MSISAKISGAIASRYQNVSAPVSLPAGRYQSVAGFAMDNDLSAVAIQQKIARGELPAYRIGRAWIIKID